MAARLQLIDAFSSHPFAGNPGREEDPNSG